MRPIGRKRAKILREKREESGKNRRLAAESVEAQKEQNEAFKRNYEITLFTTAPERWGGSEPVEYFFIMRSRAISKLRQEEGSTSRKECVLEEYCFPMRLGRNRRKLRYLKMANELCYLPLSHEPWETHESVWRRN